MPTSKQGGRRTTCSPSVRLSRRGLKMSIARKAQLLAVVAIAFGAPQAWAQVYVPFKVEIDGGICDSAGASTSNPEIEINGNGASGTFLVNSALLKTDSVPVSGT